MPRYRRPVHEMRQTEGGGAPPPLFPTFSVCIFCCDTVSGKRPHHRSGTIPNFQRPGQRRPPYGRRTGLVPMRLRAAYVPRTAIIVCHTRQMFPWNSKIGIPEAPMAIVLRIYHQPRAIYPWVVDWFDRRSGARYEARFDSRALADACRRSVLAEGGQ
jgi:hypothetical protein